MTTTFEGKKPLAVKSSAGELYIMDAIVTDPSYASIAAWNTGLHAIFFTDSATLACRALQTGAVPYAILSGSGLEPKLEFEKVMADADNSTEMVVGHYAKAITMKATILDLTVDKLTNLISAASADKITTAAGATIAAAQTLIVGHQKTPNRYALMWRTKSNIISPTAVQEYDHWIYPFCTIVPKAGQKFSQKDKQDFEIEITAQSDPFFYGGPGPVCVRRHVTAVAAS